MEVFGERTSDHGSPGTNVVCTECASLADIAFFVNKPIIWGYYHIKNPGMSTLTIRDVEPAVKEQLRVRAARNGRSMEDELRAILIEAVGTERDREPNLAAAIRRRFQPFGGVDDLEPHPPVTVVEPSALDR
jgi:antitoxin FitA